MKPCIYIVLCAVLPALLLGGCGPALTATPTPKVTSTGGPATVVSLTFDDGDADNFAVGAVLQQYGLHATWYIPSGLVGETNYMTWAQLEELQSNGNEIGGHSLNHLNIGELASEELRHQVCDDRRNLSDHGFSPISFAYPFGGYSESARAMVQECGYKDARTIGAGPESIPAAEPYALRAFPYVVDDTDFTKLQRYVTGTRHDAGGWVILIFHHVCESCDYYAVKPDILTRFVRWLADEQALHRLSVRTVGEVMTQGAQP